MSTRHSFHPYLDGSLKILPFINDDLCKELYKKTSECKLIMTWIDKNCKFGCDHCYASCNDHRTDFLTEELFDELLNKINDDWIVGFLSGEPLDLDILSTRIKKAKSRGHKVLLLTSGYWFHRPEELKTIESLDIEYILISVDKFHSEKIKVDYDGIKQYFNEKNKLTYQCVLYSPELSIDDERKGFDPSIWPLKLSFVGNIYDLNLLKIRNYDVDKITSCAFKGFIMDTDGRIQINCDKKDNTCSFGNIKNISNLSDLIEKIHSAKHKGHYDIQKICTMMKIKNGKTMNCFDNKWIDPDYNENHDYIMEEE